MCLYSKTPIPSIAQEDIICYKLVKVVSPLLGIGENMLMTPYMLEVIDSKKFPFILKASSNKPVDYYGCNCCFGINIYTIGEGFIHAYTEKPLVLLYDRHRCVILCKIHKGTKYYVSLEGTKICASEMELIKII